MRAGFSAEGQLTKLSTRQLWLVVSKFFASEKSAGEVKQREMQLLPPRPAPDKAICTLLRGRYNLGLRARAWELWH